jgi:aldose 1-epimerase
MKKVFSRIVFTCLTLVSLSSFSIHWPAEIYLERQRAARVKPSISKTLYGEIKGVPIYEYTLKNSKGMQVKVINYGATISDIITPDKNGALQSVVLGFDSLSGYTGPTNSVVGAAVGRVANRIANKKFTLDGKEYTLTSTIHGGLQGFSKRIWNIEELPGKKNVGLKLTYTSKDGEEGFPGNVNVSMVYTLTHNNELKVDYSATTDKATPVVLTNHSYFNLSGGRDDKALDTELTIAADQYLESGAGGMPTGKLVDVKGTPFDFTVPRKIGERINENNEQLKRGSGYDICYVLRNKTGRLALAARAYEPVSGRVMEVYTTEPGVIFYTANHISERLVGRGGKPSTKNSSFCLETQHFPDSPNQPHFPNTILRPGEKFRSQTVFRFSVSK